MHAQLSGNERDEALKALPRWRLCGDGRAIERDLRFADFTTAFAFMSEIAQVAEAMDHHPDWSNCHARVAICLTTHDAGGLTRLDIDMAHTIDRAAQSTELL